MEFSSDGRALYIADFGASLVTRNGSHSFPETGVIWRVVREGTVIYDTTVESLRRFSEDVREVTSGFECGIVLANFQDVHEGDVLEVYETRLLERELTS